VWSGTDFEQLSSWLAALAHAAVVGVVVGDALAVLRMLRIWSASLRAVVMFFSEACTDPRDGAKRSWLEFH
jgi:hypothetical protein